MSGPGQVDVSTGVQTLLLDPTRLSVTALLAATQWAEFKFVRDSAALSDSALSKQAATLEAAGYVRIRKGHVGNRPRTWYQLTDDGRTALTSHLHALQRIAHDASSIQPSGSAPAPAAAGGSEQERHHEQA